MCPGCHGEHAWLRGDADLPRDVRSTPAHHVRDTRTAAPRSCRAGVGIPRGKTALVAPARLSSPAPCAASAQAVPRAAAISPRRPPTANGRGREALCLPTACGVLLDTGSAFTAAAAAGESCCSEPWRLLPAEPACSLGGCFPLVAKSRDMKYLQQDKTNTNL